MSAVKGGLALAGLTVGFVWLVGLGGFVGYASCGEPCAMLGTVTVGFGVPAFLIGYAAHVVSD